MEEPGADSWIALASLPVALRTGSGPVLEVRTGDGTVERL
jgi:hypothetical protein